MNFQSIIFTLNHYWSEHGCVILQPYDMEVGAGTFHPATFLGAIGPEPASCAYVQPSRRPTDGRYGDNPNRLQHYFQYQVALKPSPAAFQDLYIESLARLGIDPLKDDVRFVEDDWESPTLGAWGLGWEVWLNGMEITQVTYFQQVGGLECRPVTGEITYGLERIAMYIQGVDNVFDLQWNDSVLYGDIYLQNEQEQSAYNFEHAETDALLRQFESCEKQCRELAQQSLPLPAYEQVLNASHAFNLLDARRVIGVTERARYIARVRNLARQAAKTYYASREALQFPRCKEAPSKTETSATGPAAPRPVPDTCAPLLVEIGTEELPPLAVSRLAAELKTELQAELRAVGLAAAAEATHFATPRRIAVLIEAVRRRRADREVIKRGPPLERAFDADGNALPAVVGFAKSCGIEVTQLTETETEKGRFVAVHTVESGQDASDLIPQCIQHAVSRLSIPKKMRWGSADDEFVRPVHWFVVVHGEDVIDCELFSVRSGRSSLGHRFHAPASIPIRQAESYAACLLETGRVQASWSARRQTIADQIDIIAERIGGQPMRDEGLLDEITSLTEWPFAFCGRFDEQFLRLPSEVLICSMRQHQKYVALKDDAGALLAAFIGVANIKPADSAIEQRIVTGNERVLRARLADAQFFFNQDFAAALESKCALLNTLVFHHALGSVFDKTERVSALAQYLAGQLQADASGVVRAAQLSKADLVTEMVGEFPDLQGVMGQYYALHDGESPAVACAIAEHYLPRAASDDLPASTLGRIIAIADRVDSILGLISVGEQARGDRDPYSLRRMALAVMRIVIECQLDIDLLALLQESARIYTQHAATDDAAAASATEHVGSVQDFMLERLRAYYLERGYAVDEFNSVHVLKPARPLEFDKRLRAVRSFREVPEFRDLTAANKRIRNILRNSGLSADAGVDAAVLSAPSEVQLHSQALDLSRQIAPLITAGEHAEILRRLAVLRDPIDQFFSDVMVMTEDAKIRHNRIALVAFVSALFREVADLSELQPDRDAQ